MALRHVLCKLQMSNVCDNGVADACGSRDRMGNTEDQETGQDIDPRTGLPRDPNQDLGRQRMPDEDMNPDLENEQKWSSGTSNGK